ncbi:hypothetical protein CEXT_278591 [Caerostris extrusa]|uniref:Uncharacterized protein n=1 Tax=Caerostris extrusa TaxID=172846 RepID=A0AAV4XLA7_CAEEX|nr:hypothetical protein CEXT_278591 [Caerostris extrusa]
MILVELYGITMLLMFDEKYDGEESDPVNYQLWSYQLKDDVQNSICMGQYEFSRTICQHYSSDGKYMASLVARCQVSDEGEERNPAIY